MKVLIECPICKKTFWVKADSEFANSYHVHENADFSECCEHLRLEGLNLDSRVLDCDSDESDY